MTRIWLFVGALLCHSGLIDAECKWKITEYASAPGGKLGNGTERQQCIDNCLADVTCKGFDYERVPAPASCWYFDTVKVLQFDNFADHYDLICDDDPCGSYPCLNGATCIAKNGTFQCSCQSQYNGTRCEMRHWCEWKITSSSSAGGGKLGNGTERQQCMDNCRADATCKGFDYQRIPTPASCWYFDTVKVLMVDALADHYTWFCNDDPCGANPCRNGATCIAKGESFRCSCQSEYTGTYCEIKQGCNWIEIPYSIVPHGTWSRKDSLSDCQTACLLYSNCRAVDWRNTTKSCMFHPSFVTPEKSEKGNHYIWVC